MQNSNSSCFLFFWDDFYELLSSGRKKTKDTIGSLFEKMQQELEKAREDNTVADGFPVAYWLNDSDTAEFGGDCEVAVQHIASECVESTELLSEFPLRLKVGFSIRNAEAFPAIISAAILAYVRHYVRGYTSVDIDIFCTESTDLESFDRIFRGATGIKEIPNAHINYFLN